jgi:protein SCO1/2
MAAAAATEKHREVSETEQARGTLRSLLAARLAVGPAVAAFVVLALLTAVLALHPRGPQRIGGPFRLIDAGSGRVVTDRDFHGKWLMIYFGYAHCPDACPVTLANMAGAMQELGPLAAQIQPIFISVDPERDTPPVLADCVSAFDNRIIGLSGGSDAIAATAKAFRVTYIKRSTGDDYTIDHTATVYVMDPDGRYATSILPSADSSDMAKQMRKLLSGPREG